MVPEPAVGRIPARVVQHAIELDFQTSRRGQQSVQGDLLVHERPYLFTFLYCPGLDATNNVSERAIRALIGARKNWGGNRTPRGARAQAVLTSILQTAKQQGKKPFAVLLELLCGRDQHKILDLVPGTREATQDSSRAAKAGGRLLSSTPERAVPRELLALHATSPPVGPVSAAVQP